MSVVSSSVWPSGGAVATWRVAITELPPGLLSTSTGTPRTGASRSARLRATTSVPPPGANGTTMRMGWLGKSAAPATARRTAPPRQAGRTTIVSSSISWSQSFAGFAQPVAPKSGARRSPKAVMPSRAAAVQATAPKAR